MRIRLAFLIAGLSLLVSPGAASATIVTNGDFETGSLSGWQQQDVLSSASGTWFAYTGTASPLHAFTVPAPPQGNFAAITDQIDEGLHVLYQDVTLPPGGSVNQLGLTVYYDSQDPIVAPDSLDPSDGPNQQYRIDVMRPSAAIDSVAAGDVLFTVFRTLTGDPQTLGPTQKSADLTPFAGQTVRIRLAEVDNQFYFNAGVDAVAVNSNGFTIGKASLNKKKGTAQLPVTVPDAGTLKISGKGVNGKAVATKAVAVSGGTVKLLIKPKGKTKSKLNDSGKAKVKVQVTYKPTGLTSNSEKAKVKLKKRT
jgi:hypothetical protein